MPSSVRITAPSRIHFGLLSLDEVAGRRFGGAGAMVQHPHTEIVVRKSDWTTVTGQLAHRVEKFIELWREATQIEAHVECEVVSSTPEHVGLGLGTQLGLSVAWALDSLFDRADVDLEQRARSVGRGNRSAVGAYGFRDGGFIVDAGKTSDQSLGELRERIALPEQWCVALVRLKGVRGLAGQDEVSAFASLPPVNEELRTRLRRELHDRMVPAARAGDFETFSESVYQYGISAGECFAVNQGGPFLTSEIADFVQFCREAGVPGVGQTSWGPSVYCWFPNRESADGFVNAHLENLTSHANFPADVIVSPVSQCGAKRSFE